MRSRFARSRTRTDFSFLDLFSGCGGLTEGLATAATTLSRLRPASAIELDRAAAATYAANFGPRVFVCDVAHAPTQALKPVDVVVGGPPCQGFSTLGKKDPSDVRNKLWRHYAAIVARVRPLYFVIENVPPFLKSDDFRYLQYLMGESRDLGDYTLAGSPMDVNSADFGSAQQRRRAVVVGRLRDLPPLALVPVSHRSTVADAIGSTPFDVSQTWLPNREAAVRCADRELQAQGVFVTSELHVTRRFGEVSLQRFGSIPPGGNRHDIPAELQAPCWRSAKEGWSDVMGRLRWDRPSVVIRTEFWKPEKGRYLHPAADRTITHLEAALLQGFPLNYRWCGSKAAIGRQIGNAVPIELGRAIGQALLAALEDAAAIPRAG